MLVEAAKEAARRSKARVWELRGANLAVQSMTDAEILLCGPAGSGKTLGVLVKIDRLMRQYPGARWLIVRKVRADLAQSTLVTFERDVLGEDNPICSGVQREYRQVYRYPNGSEIVVGGMDRPGKILSAEYDGIYPAEAVQFTEQDWETFVMRTRNGVLPFQQVIGDTNPDRPDHWLKRRCDTGVTTLLNSFHKDNPAYWDGQDWTARGRDYVLGKLQRLTGVRRARYLENKWVVADGAVYDGWNESIHLIDPFEVPKNWRRIRMVDFGYTNPFVCLWGAVDPDGRLFIYRQLYMTQRTVRQHAAAIQQYSDGEYIEATVADHDAEDRATLRENGIQTLAANKAISVGIQKVSERLAVAGDGKPRIYVLRGSLIERDESLAEASQPVDLASEMPGYVWAKAADGKPNKEQPVDLNNHALDALRYGVMYLDGERARSRANPIY